MLPGSGFLTCTVAAQQISNIVLFTSIAIIICTLSRLSSAAQTLVGPFDCTSSGSYTLCQNLWGADAGVGSRSTTLARTSSSNISWSSSPNDVKSRVQIDDVSSIPTNWNWQYHLAFSYDIWLGIVASGGAASAGYTHEIMNWLSSVGGAQPIGDKKRPNKNWKVLSFVAIAEIKDFKADLSNFFEFLSLTQGVSPKQYIHIIQASTEPFVGSANFVTNSYSISMVKY
ncbi:concanavalin A-like lectin/glucanase domain-containing protein [Crucibulum laeve]|uniref:Concanavalin A-like lectin/glucanase domain-containing protein n=1 Tax=Crucibulum laeve TaxID=68775 RepID=A0A5C3LU91_9AGAR|nr:concanavalin A-like lectin/glucanase domain-containing protein [Crucibulum laeve]